MTYFPPAFVTMSSFRHPLVTSFADFSLANIIRLIYRLRKIMSVSLIIAKHSFEPFSSNVLYNVRCLTLFFSRYVIHTLSNVIFYVI